MILYLDTSSLVKLYVEEDESDIVDNLVKSAKVTATSIVAYAEARAAFARRFRENAFTKNEYNRLVSAFNDDWRNYLIINVKEELVKQAGTLAEKHSLRGFDAIHLSSAVTVKQKTASSTFFSCFDIKLQTASQIEGLLQP